MRRTGQTPLALPELLPLLALLALLGVPPGLAIAAGSPETSPVRQLGRTVAQWKDDVAQVVVSYKWTGAHLDEPWMLLDTRISAAGPAPFEVDREDISLETPSGARIPLPSQEAAAKGMPNMPFLLKVAAVAPDPLNGYFPSATREERLGFFEIPCTEVVFSRVGVSHWLLVSGWLLFESPKGKWDPGTYTLVVKNKAVDVRLPFTLPSGVRKDGSGVAVPW